MRSSAKQSQPHQRLRSALVFLLPCLFWAANVACVCRPIKIEVGSTTLQSVPTVTITVGSALNGGDGSLRQAIEAANLNPGATIITFDLPPNNLSIALNSPLPPIGSGVTINGFNRSGGQVELNGANIAEPANGLTIIGANNTMQGLVINRFRGHGILFSGRDSRPGYKTTAPVRKLVGSSLPAEKPCKDNQVVSTTVGTDITGQQRRPNSGSGIFIGPHCKDILIKGNILASNQGDGITLSADLPSGANPPTGITMSMNIIYANGGMGIDLGDDNVANNIVGEPAGPNNWVPFPTLIPSAGNAPPQEPLQLRTFVIRGTFKGVLGKTYTLEFFIDGCPNPGCPPGEALCNIPMFVGTKSVTVNNPNGELFEHPITIGHTLTSGFVNSTATRVETRNTSELAECVLVHATSQTIGGPFFRPYSFAEVSYAFFSRGRWQAF